MNQYRQFLKELRQRKEQGSLFYVEGKLDVRFLNDVATLYNMREDRDDIGYEFDMAFDDMIEKANRWTDKDPDFPSSPSHYGWELDGYVFITSYEGEAGCYWYDEYYDYPVCRP